MRIDDADKQNQDKAATTTVVTGNAVDEIAITRPAGNDGQWDAGGRPTWSSENVDHLGTETDAEILAAAHAILGPPPDLARGHHVMDPAALRAEVGDHVDPSEDEPTSAEEGGRIKRLRGLAADPDGLYRRHVVADAAMITRLADLRARAPQAGDMLDIVIGATRLSARAGSPIEVPPIVLLGPPGCGKSWLARELASALDIAAVSLLGSTMADAAPILGTAVGWRGSGPGTLAEAVLKSPRSALLVFVDEVEKMRIWDRRSHASDIFLGLLDRDMAAAHEDLYYRIPMRADRLIWLFAANSLDDLSDPFLDRCLVVEMQPPGPDDRRAIVGRIAADVRAKLGLDPTLALGEAALDGLCDLSLRRVAPALTLALGRAAEAGRDDLAPDDLAWACALVERGRQPRRSVGFFPRDR